MAKNENWRTWRMPSTNSTYLCDNNIIPETLMGDECSHKYPIPAPSDHKLRVQLYTDIILQQQSKINKTNSDYLACLFCHVNGIKTLNKLPKNIQNLSSLTAFKQGRNKESL